MRWALIESNTVANVVEQDSQPQIPGVWVACGDAGPGWHYVNGVFETNQPPMPIPEISAPTANQ